MPGGKGKPKPSQLLRLKLMSLKNNPQRLPEASKPTFLACRLVNAVFLALPL
jgi:hypothetical protein